MGFAERMTERADRLSEEVSQAIKSAMSVGFDNFTEQDWNEIYDGLNVQSYLSFKEGKILIEVSISDEPRDSRYFDLNELVSDLIDYEKDEGDRRLADLAHYFEEMAKNLREHFR